MSKLTLENAPIGTEAPAIRGGYWERTQRGWMWVGEEGNGSTFPKPGGDWTGKLLLPIDWPLQSFDAQDWAEAFHKRFPAVSVEDALGWFANALMRGYDEYRWRLDAAERLSQDDPPEFTAEAMKDAVLTLPGQSLVATVEQSREQRHAEYPPHPGPEAEERAKQMVEVARRSFGLGQEPQPILRSQLPKGWWVFALVWTVCTAIQIWMLLK